MAIHRRGYRPYDGPRTAERFRFRILTRYALGRVFQSRLLVIFYVLCFVPTLVAMSAIYISHNVDLLAAMFPRANVPSGDLIPVTERFFLPLMSFQATLSVFVTAIIGPGLISPDLTNNALPLYFSRPFSRAEYLIGKFSVLFILLFMITGLPMLLIYALKSGLAGWQWLVDNIHLAFAIARRITGLGCADFTRLHGRIRLGPMAAGSCRNAFCALLHPDRFRRRSQRDPSDQLGKPVECHRSDRHSLEFPVLR